MPGRPLSRATGRLKERAAGRAGRGRGRARRNGPAGRAGRRSWLARFRDELASVSIEPDPFIRLIIVERLVKSTVLLVVAVSLLTADRLGYLSVWAARAQDELNLTTGHGLIARVLTWAVEQLGHLLPHLAVVAIAIILYAALEATEGVGLAMRRRWAEYLTVLATAVLIPYEAIEVVHRPTVVRVGALVVNVAIVVYLSYRKRLFVDV
jgi:uncharacterized membrane protein (DUF2068 family)